jgi:hypothetical protein
VSLLMALARQLKLPGIIMLLCCFSSGGLAAADVDLEMIQKEIETLKSRLEELEQLIRTSQERKETQQDRESIVEADDQIRPEVLTELEASPLQSESVNNLDLGGSLWMNYGYLSWDETNKDRDGNFDFTLFRLDANARHDDFLFSAQYRWYSYMDVIHHGWIGYDFSPQWQVQLGIMQSPFGILPYASHSWWFGMPYYVGLEDDYDAGIKAIYSDGPWNAQFAFFKNDEYASGTRTKRFSFDVLHDESGNCSLTDCNEEINQLNTRVAYDWRHGEDAYTQFGLSGEWGQLYNKGTKDTGDHWAYGAHADGHYGPWNLQLEAIRYRHNPENPAGVSDDTITYGAFASTNSVASDGVLLVANVARDFRVSWGPVSNLLCYNDYSVLLKDENRFDDSMLNTLGCLVTAGPTYTYVDLIAGKNATFMDDPLGTGMGQGAGDEWETRFNINFEYYF